MYGSTMSLFSNVKTYKNVVKKKCCMKATAAQSFPDEELKMNWALGKAVRRIGGVAPAGSKLRCSKRRRRAE